jgi:hypothetical protein
MESGLKTLKHQSHETHEDGHGRIDDRYYSPIFAGGATCLIDTQLSSFGRAFSLCLDGF